MLLAQAVGVHTTIALVRHLMAAPLVSKSTVASSGSVTVVVVFSDHTTVPSRLSLNKGFDSAYALLL